MKNSILLAILQGMIAIALIGTSKAGEANAPAPPHTLRIVLITNETKIVSGLIDVQGYVVSKSTNQTIRYTSWIKTAFVDKANGKQQEVESSFNLHDKSLSTVSPGATNIFVAMLGGVMSDYHFSGKGAVLVYATPEGTNGIDNRISNLITLDADIEKSRLNVVEEKP